MEIITVPTVVLLLNGKKRPCGLESTVDNEMCVMTRSKCLFMAEAAEL